jgi:hypothetical protein
VSSPRRIGAVLSTGLVYALVGILFAMPAGHVRAWRLAAWGVSTVAFAAHIAYERFRVRSPALSGALRIALAVALGAFGLAVGANLHSLSVASSADQHRRLLLLALALWPVLTALPAFLVALAAGGVLTRLAKRAAERKGL